MIEHMLGDIYDSSVKFTKGSDCIKAKNMNA